MAGSLEAYQSSLERRNACRYSAQSESAALGWWEGTEFRAVVAQVKNISLDGALTLVDVPPPDDSPVWIRLEGSPVSDWVEALVVQITKGRQGPHHVRLKFPGGCPYTFFDSAIHRFGQGDGSPTQSR